MNYRFYNAKLAFSRQGDIINYDNTKNLVVGELWTSGGDIVFSGSMDEAAEKLNEAEKNGKPFSFDDAYDLKGNLIIPGFKDAHTHSAMTFLRSYADGMALQDWLTKQVFPMEARLDPEAVYIFTKLAILEYLSSGITSVFDMYFFPDAFSDAVIDSGYRAVLCGSVNDFGGSAEEMHEDFLRFNKKHPRITYMHGFHAEYTSSPELLKQISYYVNLEKQPCALHISETKKEVLSCKEKYGMTPPEFLESVGIFNYGGTVFHAVHLSENDISIFKRRNIKVVSNPSSNAKLASGIADLLRFKNEGIEFSLGTDGAASNNALDFFREMYLASVLQNLLHEDPAAIPALDILKAAVCNGAYAMGLPSCCDISAGKKADFAVIDLLQPNMQPEHSILNNLVYSGSKTNVRMTVVDGKILYKDGEYFTGYSPESVYEEAEKKFKEMLEK